MPTDKDSIMGGYVAMTLPIAECAALKGYDNVEDYLLRERSGFTPAEIGILTEEQRRAAIGDVLYNNAVRELGYKGGTGVWEDIAVEADYE